jgi:alpha-beta hydrolase superfamily lysophospholipase
MPHQPVIHHTEATFPAFGGLNLYYQCWRPPGEVRAVLALVHGLGGHSGVFTHVVEHFLPQDYAIYALDCRGSGRSPGQRGYIQAWQEYREDIQAWIQRIRQDYPQEPLFLLGHSLGGVIVLDYVLRSPEAAATLKGLIVWAPVVGKVGVPPLRMALGRLLSWLWPRFSLKTGLSRTSGSRDPAVVLASEQDPLRHCRGTARLVTEWSQTTAWLHQQADQLPLPFLLLQGTEDSVALLSESRQFYQRVSGPDKELCEYLGTYHELFDDFGYEDVLRDLQNWLERHLPSDHERPRSSESA